MNSLLPSTMTVLLITGEYVSLHGEYCELDNGVRRKISELPHSTISDLIAIGAINGDDGEDWAHEEAHIYACELVGPNSLEYEDVFERRYEELLSSSI